MKTFIVIPAYNEAKNIGIVVRSIQLVMPEAIIVVVSDGSHDDTVGVARQAGAIALAMPYNVGIGGAVQTGLLLAVNAGADYVVRMDGDGQHLPDYILPLLQPLIADRVDVAIGSRFYEGAPKIDVSLPRKIGITLFSLLTSILSGNTVRDPTSGFIAMNAKVAAFLAGNITQDYPEVDGRVLLARVGFRSVEIPVTMNPRIHGVSSINTWRAFYYLLKVTLCLFVARSREITVSGLDLPFHKGKRENKHAEQPAI